MAVPQVVLPVPFGDIPAEVDRLREHGNSLRLEGRMTQVLLDAVRKCCPHPKEKVTTYNDRAGTQCSSCDHCGKEW